MSHNFEYKTVDYKTANAHNEHLNQDKPYPLEGILVLDMTHVLAGPTCGRMLADAGARVIHIERPPKGDDSRSMGPYLQDGSSEYFRFANAGKESITLDLKAEEDMALFKRMLKKADVVVENFRPGVMKRLGLDPEELVKTYPGLIVASISGFGQYGPMSQQAAYDTIIQAISGLMDSTGFPDGPATRVGTSISDVVGGIFGYCGVVTALMARERTGKGSTVDISMLDATFSLLAQDFMSDLGAHQRPHRLGNRHPYIYPFDTFKTKDSSIAICAGNDHLWQKLCQALGHPEWGNQAEFSSDVLREKNWQAVKQAIESVTTTDTSDVWCDRIEKAGVPVGPILNIDDTRQLPQIVARGMVKTMDDGFNTLGSPMKFSAWNSYGAKHDSSKLNAEGDAIRQEFSD